MSSTSVRFGEGELDAFRAAADAAGLRLNAWVRRACRDAADLERALAREDEAVRVPPPAPVVAERLLARVPERAFRPDPRPVSTKKKRR